MAGDDLIWYFTNPKCPFEVQVDPGMNSLFLISTDEQADYVHAKTVDEAVETVTRWLHLDTPPSD